MPGLPSHKTVLILACLLWFFSFLAEATGHQPYSTIGIYIAPVLMLLGLMQFVVHLRRKKRFRRKAWEYWRANPESAPKPDVNNPNIVIFIILGFWTGCICIWMALAWLGGAAFRNSEAFAAVKSYCSKHSGALHESGGIRSYGFLVGGTIYDADDSMAFAQLSFMIVGKAHNVPGEAKLFKRDGIWIVKELQTGKPVN